MKIALILFLASYAGWLLMGFFILLAIAFSRSRLLKGFSFTMMIFAAVSLAMYYPAYFQKAGGFRLSVRGFRGWASLCR